MTPAVSFFVYAFVPTHKNARTHGIPTEIMIPQKTSKLEMSLEI